MMFKFSTLTVKSCLGTFLALIFISFFLAFSLVFIFIKFELIENLNEIGFFDTYVRFSFILIGSSISSLVAISIFLFSNHLTLEEKKNFENLLERESKYNVEVLLKLKNTLEKVSSKAIASHFKQNKSHRELFQVQYAKLNFDVYEMYLRDFKNHEIKLIRHWSQLSKIKSYLYLLLNEIEDEKNMIEILEALKNEMRKLNAENQNQK